MKAKRRFNQFFIILKNAHINNLTPVSDKEFCQDSFPDTFVYSTFHCLVQLHVCRIVTYFGNILCIFF